MRLLLCLIFVALAAVVWGTPPLIPCYRECDLRLMSDEDDFDVSCNETCKIQKCHEGCALFTSAILSSCHEVCHKDRKIFNKENKMNLYCTRGCNIAINIYMQAIEDEVGTPPEPYLVAETRTNTSITIKWASSAYENISYLIQLRYDNGAHHLTDWEYYRPAFLLKDNNVTVQGLSPYTKYRFRVAWIILQNYPPLFSEESIVISTLPYGAPSSPPVITCLTAVSCSRVSLSWDPPPFPNGPILSYVLYIEKYGGNIMIKDISDTSDGLHYMINNLEPTTKYKVSLSTRNSMGEGPADVRNITTLSKKDVSSFTPAFLLFGSKHCVLKQGLKILDESQVLYKVQNDSITVNGLALHVKNSMFFVSDSQGNILRVNMKQNKGSMVIHSSLNNPTILSLDWLHEKLYMAEETQITRCDTDGSNYEVVLKNMKHRAKDMHVDPLNGYLYMSVTDHVSIGGLYRIDLVEFDNGLVLFDKAQLIVNDYELTAFVVDYKNFRILLPSSNNSIVSIALDGSDISDIRENSQTQLYKNIRSVAVHQDLLYYTTGNVLYGEEYHAKEDRYYNNVYLVDGGPFLSINVQHLDNQPYPVPLNPVESVEALFESEMARISWSSPRLLGGQGKGAYQKWSYEVELLDHVNFLTVLGVNITQTFYDIYNLNPNTSYSVKVRAYSDRGKGPFSTEFSGSTLKSYESDEKPFILYGAREGLLRSDFLGQNVEPLILKMNLNNYYITDICYYNKMVFINTNTTVYVYNNNNTSLTRLQNITMATSIAIDWFAPKLYYSSASTQMITRSNIDGSLPEPLPILTIAKELTIDSLNAHLYWTTPYSVERSRLNGLDHYVYMKNPLFSGRMVMGLTLDFDKKKLYFMVRSYEGSIMYRSGLADMVGTNNEKPEIVGYLSASSLHGPVKYFNNRVYWLDENQKASVSDVNGLNFAHIKGLGLSGLTSLEIIDSSLQPYPNGLSIQTIRVVPPSINEDAIHINGTHDSFNIAWEPVISLNYGPVFYEVRVDDGDEVYSLVTNHTFWQYPTMKRLPPFSSLTIGMKAFSYYASSKQTIVNLNSPMSIPSEPLHPRVFITHKSSPFHHNEDIIADFRWSPPAEANGIILTYAIKCWLIENNTEIFVCDSFVDGKKLQFQTSDLLPNCTYYFKVYATTQAGTGEPSDVVQIETSVERPIPRLLLANTDSVKVADIDFHEEKLLFGKASHPAAIAYLAVEKTVFWIEEGALMVSSIDGTNASLIKHLTSEGTTLSVDWIGRQLYWVEVNEGFSCVWSADLSYNSYRNIFNSSSIIRNLEVEPFSRSLIWTSASNNNLNLMISDISGANIRPFFSQTLEYQSSVSKMKVKRTKTSSSSCNCLSIESVGEAMAIDSTNRSALSIIYVDGELGHIWSSDIEGCKCQMLLNATSNYNSGLPPTSITVDNCNIYYSNKTQQKLYSIKKAKAQNSDHIDFHSHVPHVEEEIRGIRSIRAIGHHLQPYPDVSCLISESYQNKAELVKSTSHTLVIFLPAMHRKKFCSSISSPSLLYTIYYGPSNDSNTHICLHENERNHCKYVNTHNNTVVLSNLRPFTNYSIRVSATNYYSKGYVSLGPEAIYQTAAGTPSPPINVTAKSITPYKINVSWEPPFLLNGDYVFYEIQWKVMDASKDTRSTIQSECGTDPNPDLSANIITTDAGKNHCITVRAYSADCKLYSDSEDIYVSAFPLPNNVTFMNSSSSSLLLSWKSPTDDSIASYFVEYSDEIQQYYTPPVEIEVGVSKYYDINIENLYPKTKYSCKLVLQYREKTLFTWPQSYSFHFFTSGDVPSSPGSPQAKNIGREVYQISWIESINYGYSNIVYELEMRSELEQDTRDWIYVVNSSETKYIIHNFSGSTAHYEFRVKAFNEFGSSNFSYSEKLFYIAEARALIDAADDPFGIIIASSVAVIILLCVFFSALYIVFLRREKCKKMLQDVAPSNELMSDIELATLQDLPLHANFVHQTNALYNLNELPTDEELIALPQIHRDQIIVTKFLGSGAFGEVFEGIACGIREDVPSLKIAIKTLKKGATDHEKEEFLKEAKLMSNFKHNHILELLGVCFDNNPNFLILELMEGGDLLSYLRNNRPTVVGSNLTMDDLIQICIDVAEGCKYLEDMHFVHRDLAARNCLVSSYDRSQRIVKIGDFGLARDIYKNDYYKKQGEGLLPVRWMAPESLVYGVFSNESDVWAFGVLLWEVITLGMQPYPARSNMEVLYYVRAGGRLEKPENCPDDLHEIMLGCWSYDSDSRPTFCYCLHALKEIRTKLVSSTAEMPSVYNFSFFNQRNLGFDNLGYCGSIMRASIASSKSVCVAITGDYIGRQDDEDTDENKLLDPNFDSRSTQSGPAAASDITLEANPTSMRRSLSWTNTMFQTSDIPVTCAMKLSAKLKGRKLTNKYLELLGDNQDSDGYQLPLQCNKSFKKTFPIGKTMSYHTTDISSSSQATPPSFLNHQASVSDLSDCESSTNLPSDSTHEQSSASNELDLMLENFGRDRSTSMSTPDSNHSWLEDCDKWSFSTASTATCPLDFMLNNQNTDNIVSASSCIGGVDLDHSLKSSDC